MGLQNKSLRFRILFIVTIGTSILFSVLIAMSVRSSIQSQTDVARGKLAQTGFEIASEVETQMNLGFQSSKDLSSWVLEAARPGSKMDLNETTIASIFYSVLKSRPSIFGIWIELEKPFVDQKTKLKLQRKKASKEHPRYIIYWTKNLKGDISDNAATDNDLNVDETYFTNALKAGHDVATDPYVYPVDGKDVLMVSLTQPLNLDGHTAGVGGVDIDIASLQKLTEDKTIFDGAGNIGIISSSGQIVALSGLPDQINKTIWKPEQLEKWSQEKWVEDADQFRVVKKVKIGASEPWFVISSVPKFIVYAPIKTASLQMVTVSVLMLVVFIALLYMIISGMSQRLASVTQQLDQSGKDVSQISANIQTAAGDLSAASSEAASSIEETSAAVEELSSTLQLSSENASKVKNLSNECVVSAQLGQKQVDGLSENIQKISTGSKKMEEITSVIDDIAFQTNLLALNAAVEAARAGEHGRGFSVVADAVRSLAQKCSTSAKEISDLIRINVQQINEGSKQMQASRESLKQIVAAVEKVDALNSEIASMAKEQAVGISNINLAVQQLDTVTQKNAQASEGAELSSQALAAQSQNLYRYVQEISGVVLGEKES